MTPKILLLDLETSPLLGYSWGIWETNILSVVEPVKILSVAWKWLGDKQINCSALPDYKGYKGGVVDDKRLVSDLWDLLDQADICVAHNANAFDCKVSNARFIAHGLVAPSDYKIVDTLKVAKKYFKFNSNALNDLGVYLNEGQKAPTGGFQTWLKCMAGDETAWKTMRQYNIKDISLLERIYLRLRPYMSDHPNLNLLNPVKTKKTEFPCSVCQSTKTVKRGFSMTKVGRYQRFQCSDCGSWSQGVYERVNPKLEYEV